MKRWKIIIDAENEESALTYLEMLCECFKASIKGHFPMDGSVLEDPEKKEKLMCHLSKPWLETLKSTQQN